jgi:hypothetical protein
MAEFRAEFLFCPLFEPDLSAYVSNPRVSLDSGLLWHDPTKAHEMHTLLPWAWLPINLSENDKLSA